MRSPSFEFTLNGVKQCVVDAPSNTTVLSYLRGHGHTGSKEGCAEGDCGACTIALVERDAHGKPCYRAVNSCIMLLPMLADREVVTVEGVGTATALHPVQRCMVASYGSQCGYCTPGFIVSMFEAYYRADVTTAAKIADQLCGNLCRCTGYRPIRDAMTHALAERSGAADGHRQRLGIPMPPIPALHYDVGGDTFLRPTTLAELLALRAAHPSASLVAGATEIGVEINKKFRRFKTLISTEAIPELRAIHSDADHISIGGAATLTAMEEALHGDYPALHKMLAVFASRQIRNRATLAGNLVTASPIGDMAPVLLALDADVVLTSQAGSRTLPLAEFFTGYRQTVLAPHEILHAVRIPRPRGHAGMRQLCDSFKVSKRREMDIAIVAAAFAVDIDANNIVRRVRLAYGGVAATPKRALDTEALLIGHTWDEGLIALARPALLHELSPISDVRGSDVFRRGLIVSLWAKFVRGEQSVAMDAPLDFVESVPAPKPEASFALSHDSAVGHVTGSAIYVDDQAQRRRMLTLWPVCAPHAHARIVRRDATVARGMPGVACVLMAEDIPGLNDVGPVRHDEILLADNEVLYHGHTVAVVVGESLEACRAAAAKVEVEYEPLPAILSIDAAIAAESFHTEPHRIHRGDCQKALAASPHTLAGSLHIGGQEHFYLESQAAWAEAGDDGDVAVVSSTQHPSEIQAVVAHVLGIARHKVVVQSPRMGGGFGGKETQGNAWAALVALAAVRTKRPVRVQLDRDLDMMLTGKRHPFSASFRAGFTDDGKLLALEVALFSDGGWSLDLSQSICDRALFHIDNCYYVPNLDVVGRVAKTHLASNTAFRGFGGPQGMVIIEEALDRVARQLGLPPEVVRERNLYHGHGETNTTHYGQELEDNRLAQVWHGVKKNGEWAARRSAVDAWNATHPHRKRGLAITAVKFGISFTASFLNQAGALVLIYRDGSVQVNHGGTEMGQGLYTKMRGVAMRELGLPAAAIRLMKTQTDKVPNTSATAASSGADLNGAAVQDACVTLRRRLAGVAAPMLGAPFAEAVEADDVIFADGQVFCQRHPEFLIPFGQVVDRAYMQQVALSATGYYSTPDLAYDATTGHGKPFHYFAFGAAISEVEVDGLSGMKQLLRVDILHDVGDSLNPGIDRGQIEGGFVQGVGWLTGEELKWDKAGRLLSHSASTYQIPAFSDAPPDFRVALLPDATTRNTIHGSKAVGEPPLMLAISAREAIRDAVAAFGAPGGAVLLASPATHEAIFASVMARQNGSA